MEGSGSNRMGSGLRERSTLYSLGNIFVEEGSMESQKSARLFAAKPRIVGKTDTGFAALREIAPAVGKREGARGGKGETPGGGMGRIGQGRAPGCVSITPP